MGGRGNTLLQCIFGLMLSLQHFADSLGSSLGPADALMPLLPCHTHGSVSKTHLLEAHLRQRAQQD